MKQLTQWNEENQNNTRNTFELISLKDGIPKLKETKPQAKVNKDAKVPKTR